MMDMMQRREAARAKAREHLNKLSKEELIQALVNVGFVVSTHNELPADSRGSYANYSLSFTIDMQLSNSDATNRVQYSLTA